MSRVLFFPPTINGETEWISPKEDIMFQSLSELLGAYQKRDPAARSKLEIFLLYPGVHAVIFHRVSHWLYCHHLPIPWSMTRRRPILAPGWISMPVMWRASWEFRRARKGRW